MTRRKRIRDIAGSIARSKERANEWPKGTAHLARLLSLRDDIEQVDGRLVEYSWYLPVALVACVESFFKESTAKLIDSGPPYTERATKLRYHQLTIDDFLALEGRKISVGEFVAQQQSYGSLDAIQTMMSVLSGRDFLDSLRDTRPRMPWSRRNRKPVLGDPDAVYREVGRCFELRHIVCHEGAPRDPLSKRDAQNLEGSTEAFISASYYWVANLLLSHVPATHEERKRVRAKEAEEADTTLKHALESLMESVNEERRKQLQMSQEAWQRFAKLDAEFVASRYSGGLMESEEFFHYLAYKRRTRAAELRNLEEQETFLR